MLISILWMLRVSEIRRPRSRYIILFCLILSSTLQEKKGFIDRYIPMEMIHWYGCISTTMENFPSIIGVSSIETFHPPNVHQYHRCQTIGYDQNKQKGFFTT